MTSAATVSQDRPRDRQRLRIARRPCEAIQPAAPRPQRRDCQGQLLAALIALAGPDASIEQATMRPWCSATFVGAQHRIMLRIDGADRAEALAALLGEAECRLHGHIVADVVVDEMRGDGGDGAMMSLAVLTIEDW